MKAYLSAKERVWIIRQKVHDSFSEASVRWNLLYKQGFEEVATSRVDF